MFVQIGDVAFNTDRITSIHFDHQWKFVVVNFSGSDTVEFRLEEYEAFFKWWSNRNDVGVLTMTELSCEGGCKEHADELF